MMHIKRIEITEFRAFKNNVFNFSPNINCIAGYNGIGKSTLLAILSNLGELKKDVATTLNGEAFKGEFASLVRGDETFDRTGQVLKVTFENLPQKFASQHPYVPELSFRSTFQKNGEKKRYRLIPIPCKDRQTESKVEWATYYLGLSRLYPIGEAEEIKIAKNNKDAALFDKILKKHHEILSSPEDYITSSSIELNDIKKKKGMGIHTSKYSAQMNSAGQDNLGQILRAVYSFAKLKQTLGESYFGGLLLIDEIDATLHPVAQNKLLDFLYEKSLELDLQIIFTTHSLSLLKHISKKHSLRSQEKHVLKTLYLTNKRGAVELKENPDETYFYNDLMETYSGASKSLKVPVLTEDQTARWFLQKILNYGDPSLLNKIELVNTSISWTQIVNLIKRDYSYYKDYVIIFDPDLNSEELKPRLISTLAGTPFKLDKSHTNLLILPGDIPIELSIWNFLKSLAEDAAFYFNPSIDSARVTKLSLYAQGPESEVYADKKKELDKVKAWFDDNKWICDVAFDYWVKLDDNKKPVLDFVNQIKNAVEPISHRIR